MSWFNVLLATADSHCARRPVPIPDLERSLPFMDGEALRWIMEIDRCLAKAVWNKVRV